MYAFSKVTSGDGEKDRYKFCISLVQDAMPIALALPYTNVLIPKETKVCNVPLHCPPGWRGVVGTECLWSKDVAICLCMYIHCTCRSCLTHAQPFL